MTNKSTDESRKKSVLVVDDDPGIRTLVAFLLTRAGFEVVQAENGHVALDILISPQNELPDLILLDLNMPVMDGWKLRDVLVKNPTFSPIPVIVITSTHATESDLASIQPAALIRKPIHAEQFIETVLAHLAKKAL